VTDEAVHVDAPVGQAVHVVAEEAI